MNYYVYKITNTTTGEFYIGKRQCHCPVKQDPYMGSGAKIKNHISKFGENNLEKQVLALCHNKEELGLVEGAYINCNITNELCLNIAIGETKTIKHYYDAYKAIQQVLDNVFDENQILKNKLSTKNKRINRKLEKIRYIENRIYSSKTL